jgi:hypothetical protein
MRQPWLQFANAFSYFGLGQEQVTRDSMTTIDIAHARLHNQHLTSPAFKKAVDVVKWLGAVQAQDYYGAKWALGLRMKGATDEAIERAFADGEILRTHVMRCG